MWIRASGELQASYERRAVIRRWASLANEADARAPLEWRVFLEPLDHRRSLRLVLLGGDDAAIVEVLEPGESSLGRGAGLL